MPFQKTIKSEITLSGIGIHTGKKINIKLIPAQRDTGIVFFTEQTKAFLLRLNFLL